MVQGWLNPQVISSTKWWRGNGFFVAGSSHYFLGAFPLFVASLFLSDLAAGLFGDRVSRVVNAALLVAIVVCSGAITSYEFGRNPIADTERGERTNRQLFYTLVFTINFFLGGYFIAVAVF